MDNANIISKNSPRILIASTGSGDGKTTLTLGLMAALKRRGKTVQGFKCGPDYIDPGYHSAVTGRVSRNLDSWFIVAKLLKDIFTRGSSGSDISIIEGAMGLFDGRDSLSNEGSAAEIAQILSSPIILALNCQSRARSAAAIVKGFMEFAPGVQIAGVIANKVGSVGHFKIIRDAVEKECKIPVLGYLLRDETLSIPERHLGLLPAIERGDHDELFSLLAKKAEETIDLDKIVKIAQASQPIEHEVGVFENLVKFKSVNSSFSKRRVTIGVARDEAFQFYYPENLELMKLAGLEPQFFSPLKGEKPPEGVAGLYLGGGFPEEFAGQLSRQKEVAKAVRKLIEQGVPTIVECGGFMYLTQEIINAAGEKFPMVGVLPGKILMQKKRAALGYREALGLNQNNFLPENEMARGHEFHYSCYEVSPENKLPEAYRLSGRIGTSDAGTLYKNLMGGYMHFYFPSHPKILQNWKELCIKFKESKK
ncbi:MAG: cobyrinate a,c-diamide synthase [Leptospirales bacterium]